MTIFIRSQRKRVAWIMTMIFLANTFSPVATYAVTSGPEQPNHQGFQPATTTDMVDLFSGDFSYNIPLFELPGPNGGYPFNLSYQGGITMDQEASWAGLGWTLSPGAVNRQMRGLPDDFKGADNDNEINTKDRVTTTMAIDPAITVGIGAGTSLEVLGAGKDLGSAGLSVFYNSYKGFGYSIDASVGFSRSVSSGWTQGIRYGANLSLSLNSQEGASIAPSLHLGGKLGEFGLSAPYSAMSGMQNLSFTHQKNISFKGNKTADPKDGKKTSAGVKSISSTSLQLANPGYTPQITMPMKNFSLRAEFNPGAGGVGVFGKLYMKGWYSEQRLKNDLTTITSPAYGYLYYDAGQAKTNSVLDFNREKDGVVSKETPNLGIPSLTYDIYSVTGQGIGAMYRPIRNDIGIVRDPEVESESVGGSIGVDVGPQLSHVGINLSLNHSHSASGAWTGNNALLDHAKFQSQKDNDAYEPWNFKVHGELTGEKKSILTALGGTSAMRVQLGEDSDGTPTASTTLEPNTGPTKSVPATNQIDRSRKQRNEVIQTFTNEQILNSGDDEVFKFFKNQYYSSVMDYRTHGPGFDVNRGGYPKNHIAGFIALTGSGLRYNYTIPVYNNVQEEVVFSVDGTTVGDQATVTATAGSGNNPVYTAENTDKFLKKTEVSRYATSYLLTSIVGPDYVDVDNNGVSVNDLGYWVKFTYHLATSAQWQYGWREPYKDAHFIEGWKSTHRDDKGSYTYGTKDLWYLAKAETKSHVAVFQTKSRDDGKGAYARFHNSPMQGVPQLALDWIGLYSRDAIENTPVNTEPYAIKKAKFTHGYLLCGQTPNSNATGQRKLTLQTLQFFYGDSERGGFNPYEFKYNDENSSVRVYDQRKTDRWGIYKSYPTGKPRHNMDFPYADQNPGNDPNHKDEIDANAAAWSLKEIITPSGSKITVNYETDDYGYVQHKQAMQMDRIYNPYVVSTAAEGSQADFDLTDNTKIRFKLQQTIPATTAIDNDLEKQKAFVLPYLDQERWQLGFKIAMNLRTSSEDATEEYITGYANVKQNGAMTLEKANSGDAFYTYGTFLLEPESGHHPFSMRVWQHLRTNQPDVMSPGYSVAKNVTGNPGTMVDQIRAVGQVFKSVRSIFENFNDYCKNGQHWGLEIKPTRSFIRLNTVDKIKYGGGARVKQIAVDDSWDDDDEGTYGQVYDYTMEENGKIISSGVAANEPIMGGEESALRYAKKYVESVPLRADNNLFFEFPVNESYYPAPHVGYRKVTVTSLAAAALAGQEIENVTFPHNLPPEVNPDAHDITYGTTGKTVHEFYTAKEFPVITDETDKYDIPDQMSVPIPFMGNLTISKMVSTQGYSIVTNDMHGKLKKMSTYRQNAKGEFESAPISWMKYNYACDSSIYQHEKIYSLANDFKLDATDKTLRFPAANETADYTMGQENEFFLDMRQFEDIAWEGGPRINTDVIYLPFAVLPLPTVWPSLGKSTTQLRTVVANKVIFKPGVLESVQAYDGGSLVKTQNVKWDLLTGQVVLSKVNNNFDEDVFSYTIPAYTQYKGLSGAYQNIGLKIKIPGFAVVNGDNHTYQFSAAITGSTLQPGDEIILYRYVNGPPGSGKVPGTVPEAKVIYMGERMGGMKWVYSPNNFSPGSDAFTGLIVRSGFRNHLDATAGTITALKDPSYRLEEQKRYPQKFLIGPFNP